MNNNQLFIECRENGEPLVEKLNWNLLNAASKTQLFASAEFDIDFVAVTGRCSQLFRSTDLLDLLNNPQGDIYRKCSLQVARLSQSKQALVFGNLQGYLIGVPIAQSSSSAEDSSLNFAEDVIYPLAGEEYIQSTASSSRVDRDQMRSLINERLPAQCMRNEPFRTVMEYLVTSFYDFPFNICLFKYGQKMKVFGAVEDQSSQRMMQSLASLVRSGISVDIALAAEMKLSDNYVTALREEAPNNNMFSFLLSNKAGNLLLTDPASFSEAYRVIVYNSLQHVKKTFNYKLKISEDTNVKSCIENQIVANVSAVMSTLLRKLDAGTALRVEAYASLNSNSIEVIMTKLREFFERKITVGCCLTLELRQYLEQMSNTISAAIQTFRESNFTDFYSLLTLYQQFIDGICSHHRMTATFLRENNGFGLLDYMYNPQTLNLKQCYMPDMDVVNFKTTPLSLFLKPEHALMWYGMSLLLEYPDVNFEDVQGIVGNNVRSLLEEEVVSPKQLLRDTILANEQVVELPKIFSIMGQVRTNIFLKSVFSSIASIERTHPQMFHFMIANIKKNSLRVTKDGVHYTFIPKQVKLKFDEIIQFIRNVPFEECCSKFGDLMSGRLQPGTVNYDFYCELQEILASVNRSCEDAALIRRCNSDNISKLDHLDYDAFIRCFYAHLPENPKSKVMDLVNRKTIPEILGSIEMLKKFIILIMAYYTLFSKNPTGKIPKGLENDGYRSRKIMKATSKEDPYNVSAMACATGIFSFRKQKSISCISQLVNGKFIILNVVGRGLREYIPPLPSHQSAIGTTAALPELTAARILPTPFLSLTELCSTSFQRPAATSSVFAEPMTDLNEDDGPVQSESPDGTDFDDFLPISNTIRQVTTVPEVITLLNTPSTSSTVIRSRDTQEDTINGQGANTVTLNNTTTPLERQKKNVAEIVEDIVTTYEGFEDVRVRMLAHRNIFSQFHKFTEEQIASWIKSRALCDDITAASCANSIVEAIANNQ